MAAKVPIGIRILPSSTCVDRNVSYRLFILIFTFFCYTTYHLSRKPISVVKSVLHRKNCSLPPDEQAVWNNVTNQSVPLYNLTKADNNTWCDWKPFDQSNYEELLGSLDLAYLFAYAVAMFISGHLAERMSLRYFLSLGMISSGILTAAFGMGYFFDIHVLYFYIIVQVFGGLVQSSGWPAVVATVGNWYGKGKRGFIMGVWNSHTSVGNILGSLIAGVWVTNAWGWSFVVPGIIIVCVGILVFLFLVPDPEDVGCRKPDHQGTMAPHSQTITVQGENGISKLENPNSDLSDSEYSTSVSPLLPKKEEKAISLLNALKIPGVIEFSFCLFFAKLVSYTFLFWLPKYINAKAKYDAEESADLSTLFDAGGIVGGIAAGLFSDYTGARASTCVITLSLAAPMMYIYNLYGSLSYAHSVGLLLACGFFVNAPYALITTAVSADLGTHKSLHGNSKALATVTAIIDGTGSIGAALGPLLTGLISPHGWENVFYMLIAADVTAMVLLMRLFIKEIQTGWCGREEL